MPPKKIDISLKNLAFTSQKSFLKTISNNVFNDLEKEYEYASAHMHISVSKVLQAIKESMFSERNINIMLIDFSVENIVDISENHLQAIKDLLKTGKMEFNIQTEDNTSGTLEYKAFVNNELENRIIEEYGMLSDKEKASILDYQLSNKDIYSIFLDSLTTSQVEELFNSLDSELFPKHTIIAQEHDYNPIVENKPKKSNNQLKKAVKEESDKELVKGLSNKPEDIIPGETKKESVTSFAKALKEMNDLLDKRPWYERWFSITHRKQKKL